MSRLLGVAAFVLLGLAAAFAVVDGLDRAAVHQQLILKAPRP